MQGDFRVGEWLVQPNLNLITRGHESFSLEPKAMDVLVCLARHEGEVLSKERIIQAVWPDTFVTDDVLTQAIFQLRRAFRDDAKSPRFIRTIVRRGYQLIAPIERPSETSSERYRVGKRVAEGAMGEVWLAEDTLLRRRVALKFLREELEEDDTARLRFLREARIAASVNHPNICSIHDIGELDGRSFIAMEFVKGETLNKRPERGQLPVQETLQIGRKIAAALAAAHQKGIIHRDIKPSNIILTRRGQVKITDFGIAKRLKTKDQTETDWTGTLTRDAPALGTLAYMSPEQVRGKEVDRRSDLFSLGVVLYEMLSGVHPFRRTTREDTAGAILADEPDPLTDYRQDLPGGTSGIIGKLLAKNPDERHQSSGELLSDLATLEGEPPGVQSNQRKATARELAQRAAPVFAIVLLVGLTGVFWWYSNNAEIESAPPLEIRPFASDAYRKWYPRFSPDGEKVAYNNNFGDIYVKGLGAGLLQLTDFQYGQSEFAPAWSPDGKTIAYTHISNQEFTSGAIYTIPSMGGEEQKLIDYKGALSLVRTSTPTYFLCPVSWSPDGENLIYSEAETISGPARIVQLKITTREKTFLSDPPEGTLGDLTSEYSPDRSQIAFLRSASSHYGKIDLWLMAAEGGEVRRLTKMEYDEGGRPTWTADGRSILFTAQTGAGRSLQLWRVDVATGKRSLVPGVAGGWHTTVWGDKLVFQQLTVPPRDIWRLLISDSDLETQAKRFIFSSYDDQDASYSPSGKEIAFSSSRSGSSNIFKTDREGLHTRRLTHFEQESKWPSWSPDGSQIAFQSNFSGNWDIWLMDSEGLQLRQLTRDPSNEITPSWSRDGKWVYFTSHQGEVFRVYKTPTDGGVIVPVAGEGSFSPMESWDGEFVYYNRAERLPGKFDGKKLANVSTQLWRLATDGDAKEELVLPKVADWSLGERGLCYALLDRLEPREDSKKYDHNWNYSIHFRDTESGRDRQLYSKSGSFLYTGLVVSPGEDWLLFAQNRYDQLELMIAENFR